jgi:thymidine kinase
MEFVNSDPSIDIIIGPMFSGKTTELIRRLTISAEAGFSVLYINSSFDTRGEEFSTHNKSIQKLHKNIHTTKVRNLEELTSSFWLPFEIIGIDEAQFFTGLKSFCIEMAEKYKKKVIVSGLNGDFQRNSFGEINELLTHCDNINKLYSFCRSCCDCKKGIMKPALFSKRIGTDKDKIVIGDEQYIPVCRECY